MFSYKILVTIFLTLFFIGCSKAPMPKYEKEERNIMLAVDSFNRQDFNSSAYYYKDLYENTNSRYYLHRFLDVLVVSEQSKLMEEYLSDKIKMDNSLDLKRYLVLAYYKQAKDDESLKLSLEVIRESSSKRIEDYVLTADIYYRKKDYENALIYYQSAYVIRKDDVIVDKIAYLTYDFLKKEKEAIAYFENHIREFGCTVYLCGRLAALYGKLGDINSVISVYKRLYNQTKDPHSAKKVIDLYVLKKDIKALTAFLESENVYQEILLNIYKAQKNYQKASIVAIKLYEKHSDIKYLAQSAMFDLEGDNTKTKEFLKKVIAKFEKVLKVDRQAEYLNYLGYTLIDYEIDIKKGLLLVKEALEKDNENMYYLDSLALGEYKLGNYQSAYNLMLKVSKKIGSDKVVKEHLDLITNACKQKKECKVEK